MATRIRREWDRLRLSLLVRNASWMCVGQGLSVVCQGVYFILLARLLGVLEYGIYVGAMAMVMVVAQYCALGSHSVFLRYVSFDPGCYAKYWGNVLLTTLSVASFCTLLVIWLGPAMAHGDSRTLFAWVAVANCLCAQLTAAAGRVFQTFERMRITAFLNLLTNLARTVLAASMLGWLHRATSVQWALGAMLISAAAAAAAVAMVAWEYGKPEFSVRLAGERAGEGFVFALSYSTTGISNDIDKAMLGHYGMNVANGIYTLAYRVVDVCTMPLASIQAAAFPRFFQKGIAGVNSTAEYAIRIAKRTAPLALVSSVVMIIAAPIIPHVVGQSFSGSVEALRWLALLPLFRSLHMSAGDALSGAGHQKTRLTTQTVVAIFNFATNLYVIPHYGWHGAAWSSLATDGLLAILNWTVLLAVRDHARKANPREWPRAPLTE